LVVVGVVAVLGVVAAVYTVGQRSTRLDRAAAELETVQFAAMVQEPAAASAEVRAYIDRFSGTPYAIEAYLILGQLHLENGEPASAIAALEEIVPGYRSPLEVQATFLLATALEEAERWEDAASLYRQLLDRVELGFQRREAAEGLARAHLARGDRPAAIEAYRSILSMLAGTDPERARYERRLAELEAQSL
jgi:predicted negative regulator of RcsB-dependent stress response